MIILWIYWSLILEIYCVNSSKVKVINLSDRTMNGNSVSTEDANESSGKNIVVGLLLPRNFPHPDDVAYFSRLDSVLPGVILATQELQGILPDWSWNILVGDTDCNSTTGPLLAVDMFYKNRSLFLFIILLLTYHHAFTGQMYSWVQCVHTCYPLLVASRVSGPSLSLLQAG